MAPANTQAPGSKRDLDIEGKYAQAFVEALGEHYGYHMSQLSAFDRARPAPAPDRSITLFGWRVSLRRERPQPAPCPQCGGFGVWRPPYSSERVPCDACKPSRTACASMFDPVPGQPLQAGAVGRPVGSAGGRDATIVVKVYALGSGVAIPGQGRNLRLAQGAFELEAHGHRLAIDPLGARMAHWLVAPIQGDVSAIWHQVEAVDQKHLAKFGHVHAHGAIYLGETAILSLPQATGKTLFAHEIAARLGCTHIVDEWDPHLGGVTPGALHLTNCEILLEGGAQ